MRSADALGKYLRTKLTNIFEVSSNLTLRELKKSDSLKSRILEDPLFTRVSEGHGSFKVDANPPDICQALLRDYYFGYQRVSKQWKSAQLIAASNKNWAWAVITSYYCAFFGTIEALRICGHLSLSFSKDESIILNGDIDSVSNRNFMGVISNDFSLIGLIPNGEKPHRVVWENLSKVILKQLPDKVKAFPEISKFKLMCNSANGWEFPSDVRNKWNYRDAIYFDYLGDRASTTFSKVLPDKEAASKWITNQSSCSGDEEAIASIAVLANFLYSAIDETYKECFLSRIKSN